MGVDLKKTTTARPQRIDDTCKWRFTLYFEPSDEGSLKGRYFFYKNGAGNRFHSGHLPKKSHEIMKRESQLDEVELEITEDGLNVNLSSQSLCHGALLECAHQMIVKLKEAYSSTTVPVRSRM
jgi:hypothetical protein